MEKLKQSHGASVRWRSFELRPPGSLPTPPAYRARIEAKRPYLVAVAREHYGLEINPGPFDTSSRPALVGAKYAEAQGAGAAYHAAVLSGYWQHARPIGDRDVLADIAVEVGLDRDAFLAALDEPEYTAAVLADVEQAYLYGLNGVPALIFNEKYLVSGAQPYEILSRVVDQVASA